jgi:hypothetical protein
MIANTIIRNTMIIGLGVFSTNSTQSGKYFLTSDIECHTALSILESPTSTRFNNSERFSLEQLKNNKRKLESIRKLRPNWNNYEGEAFEESLITYIEKIIADLDYQPQIFPTGRGSIQIEKYIDDENLVEIEVSNNEIFAYQVKDGEEIEKEITIDEINILISDLYA